MESTCHISYREEKFIQQTTRTQSYNTINVSLLAMPGISPTQYWSFFVISNGFIPGKASLRVNGNCQTVDGGLLLDGSTSYLSSHLDSQNSLSNPGGFLSGLSFGLKLKFPASVLKYDDARYILDTGEKSAGSSGVSLYLLNKKLILELATHDTRWKVSVSRPALALSFVCLAVVM